MTPGQEVTIKSRDHPWRRFTGVLTAETLPTGQVVVELENGMRVGVDLAELSERT